MRDVPEVRCRRLSEVRQAARTAQVAQTAQSLQTHAQTVFLPEEIPEQVVEQVPGRGASSLFLVCSIVVMLAHVGACAMLTCWYARMVR